MRLIPTHRGLPAYDRLFENFFGNGAVAQWAPALNVKETESGFEVRADIPGVDPSEIEVSFKDGVLTLRGEKTAETKSEGDRWHRVERRHGSFTRSIELPSDVDLEQVAAEASNGVLTITLAKKAEAVPHRIDVQVK